jgi:hypothetical protein
MATTYEEVLTLVRELAETQREVAEAQREMTKARHELAEAQKATDLQIKETSREIAELKSLFTSQWGKLMESLVVVEVKTTLRPKDVKAFLRKLDHFKQWLPRYESNRIYGAMAWLSADAGAEAMLAKRGLFSIRATGDSAAI